MNITEQLKKLQTLKEKGIIDEGEYNQQKHQIINQLLNNEDKKIQNNITVEKNQSINFENKSVLKYFIECISVKYCCFSGRASRTEFWGYVILIAVIGGVLFQFLQLTDLRFRSDNPVTKIFWLIIFLPSISVLVRRFHDVNLSAWCLGIPLILIALMAAGGAIDEYKNANKCSHTVSTQSHSTYYNSGYGYNNASDDKECSPAKNDDLRKTVFIIGGLLEIFMLIVALMKSYPKPNEYGPVPDGVKTDTGQ